MCNDIDSELLLDQGQMGVMTAEHGSYETVIFERLNQLAAWFGAGTLGVATLGAPSLAVSSLSAPCLSAWGNRSASTRQSCHLPRWGMRGFDSVGCSGNDIAEQCEGEAGTRVHFDRWPAIRVNDSESLTPHQ